MKTNKKFVSPVQFNQTTLLSYLGFDSVGEFYCCLILLQTKQKKTALDTLQLSHKCSLIK